MLSSLRRHPAFRAMLTLLIVSTVSTGSLSAVGAHSSATPMGCPDEATAGTGHDHDTTTHDDATHPRPTDAAWQASPAPGASGCGHCAPACPMTGHCGGVAGVVLPGADATTALDAAVREPDSADRLHSLTVPPPTPPPHIVA